MICAEMLAMFTPFTECSFGRSYDETQSLLESLLCCSGNESRGHMLEMMLRGFPGRGEHRNRNSNALLLSLERRFGLLPQTKQQEFLGTVAGTS